jgi:hypothetical protein
LTLPARESKATLTKKGLVALRKLLNEGVGMGRLGRLVHLLWAGL